MAKPFTDAFPADPHAAGHADDWPEGLPGSIPDPVAPVAETPVVDTGDLPDDAPPYDLLTGLPNAALPSLPEGVPEEADDEADDHFPEVPDWL